MASPTSVQALIRALRPSFRTLDEKLVFAVHAVLASNGLRLVAVGSAAENPDAAAAAANTTEEAPLEGWNATGSDGGSYSFLYAVDPPQGSTGSRTVLLLLKCLPVEGTVLVNMLADPASSSSAQQPASQQASAMQPTTVELEASHFSPSPSDLSISAYQHLDELIKAVEKGLSEQVLSPSVQHSIGQQHQPQQKAQQLQQPQQQPQQQERPNPPPPPQLPREGFDPLRDYSQPSRGPAFDPCSVGRGDILPGGGALPPSLGGFGMGPGPLGGGGGMLVGPGNFPGRARQPPGTGPSPLHPPGARWDPIAPEGFQGWNPDDFTPEHRMGPRQGGPFIDPDVMQPGPGRGPDFDSMFG